MNSIIVVGSSGKDEHFKIRSFHDLPKVFHPFLKKTIPVSRISELLGPEWDRSRVYGLLEANSLTPVKYSYGGRAPHVAYGVARLGGRVRLVTTFGRDYDHPYPGFFDGGYYSHLANNNVGMRTAVVEDSSKTSLLSRDVLNAGVWIVMDKTTSTITCVKDVDNNEFFIIDDVEGASGVEKFRPVPESEFESASLLFVTSSETPFMKSSILAARRRGVEVVVDIASYGVTGDYVETMVPNSKMILGNDNEIKQAADLLGLKNIREFFTLGSEYPEAIVLEDKMTGLIEIHHRDGGVSRVGPVPPEKTGSSIGCCDGIAAGILFGLQKGLTLEESCRIGLLEAFSIWRVEGVQEGMLSISELTSLYRRFFGREPFT
ncbi:MAG: carbohydrate kinase family protein [Thermoproteota archaeon]|nr:carbohydrate kinase family protein [Candidatus Brockarchaeota archaeon]